MRIIHCISELTQALYPHRDSLALIPTMGALHKGHLSLVRQSQQKKTVVSIFINPLQFNPNDDFASYPRTLELDCKKLAGLADFIYAPTNETMFPTQQQIGIQLPPVADELCGKTRPGFFQGIAIVVNKLIGQIKPTHIYFGEKDFQQMVLMRLMIEQLDMSTKLIACPTIRDDDGVACSSRNTYLSDAERQIAPALYQTLQAIAKEIQQGNTEWQTLEQHAMTQLKKMTFTPDYISIRRAHDLQSLTPKTLDVSNIVILGAAWLGKTRLIDNIQVNL